jgi:signal transduction histidine kinase
MNTPDLACTLVNILCAVSVEQTLSLALAAIIGHLNPQWVCILLWDADLKRYIVGETWQAESDSRAAADLRRYVLRLANTAHYTNPVTARALDAGCWYQPLHSDQTHVGAICGGIEQPPTGEAGERYALLLRGLSRALYTNSRLEQAELEHAELDKERHRLEELLHAVEDQQRTIDHLLSAERQLSASLEAQVEERTAALRAAQDRLIQSEKLAVIGQLASSLAHELNNPLQAIQSGLGLVMTQLPTAPAAVRDDLAIIQQELERIETIFRQMLDFYRPVSFAYLPLDLNAICESVCILLRKRLHEMGLSVRLQLADSLPATCGDSNQIKQVLLNLILNAAEASLPQQEKASIILKTEPGNECVILSVTDYGHGILPEYEEHLFEPLFTTKTRGLGLGLAISREIARRHSGDITVESVPGRGTTFALRLPVKGECTP